MKTILITGATDGIGLLATQKLAVLGHRILAHGRDEQKLESLTDITVGQIEPWLADLSNLSGVRGAANSAATRVLDAVVNNAGVLKAPCNSNSNESRHSL